MKAKFFRAFLACVVTLAALGSGQLTGQVREVRVATFNTSLFRNSEGDLVEELGDPGSLNPQRVAEIIQRVDPDIILLNEFDYDPAGEALERFHANYLMQGQGGQAAVTFAHRFVAESNTGIATCMDLNRSGRAVKVPETSGYGEDAYGFGQFEGQYGMAVLSKFPILTDEVRSFQKFLWKDMPGALLPDFQFTPAPADYYSEAELAIFRLSSKSHWDLPIDVDGEIVHLLAAHPTPPTFDGSEDRNGRRNHDEIRLWADYVGPGAGGYLYDDGGGTGGIGADVRFVICGDYNADPVIGDSVDHAILQLIDNPAVDSSLVPQGSSGTTNTSSFGLRVDYVLPSKAGFDIVDGEIFWPVGGEGGAGLVGASDHRLVWMDLELVPLISESVSGLQVEVDGVDVVLTWDARPGIDYGVQSSGDLGGWTDLVGAPVVIGAGVASARDVGGAATPGRKYYRVTAQFAGP